MTIFVCLVQVSHVRGISAAHHVTEKGEPQKSIDLKVMY